MNFTEIIIRYDLNPIDFRIDQGRSLKGDFIRIIYLPTGDNVEINPVGTNKYEDIVCKLIHDLKSKIDSKNL